MKDNQKSLQIFIRDTKRERKKLGKKTEIEVLDKRIIEKNLGKGNFNHFKPSLVSSNCETFILVFRNNGKKSWYSAERDGLVINLAYSLAADEFAEAEKETLKNGITIGAL